MTMLKRWEPMQGARHIYAVVMIHSACGRVRVLP